MSCFIGCTRILKVDDLESDIVSASHFTGNTLFYDQHKGILKQRSFSQSELCCIESNKMCDMVLTSNNLSTITEFITIHIIDSYDASSIRKSIPFKRSDNTLTVRSLTEKLAAGKFLGKLTEPSTNMHFDEESPETLLIYDEYYFILEEELAEKFIKVDIKKRVIAQRTKNKEILPKINEEFLSSCAADSLSESGSFLPSTFVISSSIYFRFMS